jgi:exopolysaccharide biosynthesis polyprenyl glycosylphosphotransferase
MLRRHREIRMQIHQLMDACLFAISFWLAYILRSSEAVARFLGRAPEVDSFDDYVWLYLILLPAAPLILEAQGFYNRPLLYSRRTIFWQLFKGCLFMTLGLMVVLFLAKMLLARWVVIWFGAISFLLVFLKEELLRLLLHSKLAQAQSRRRFILVGNKEDTFEMRQQLKAKSMEEIEVLAELSLSEVSMQNFVSLLHEHAVNGVILSGRHSSFDQIEEAVRACELEGVEAWLVADFFKMQISRASFDDLYGWPVLVFRSTPEASWQSVLKLLLDYVGALVLLLLSSVPLIIIALLVKFTSPGPILFRQKRSGLNGQPFTIYKFRTMVSNAEQLKAELSAMNEMTGPVFKVTQDPRITPIGKFLRKFSIDEFPQLLNVLKGEMSLVGPRPLPVDEVKQFYDLAHRRRLSVKPGLTCLWQISGRNNVNDFKDWVRLDLEYIDNWSLWLDIKILWLTVPIVLTGTGAK